MTRPNDFGNARFNAIFTKRGWDGCSTREFYQFGLWQGLNPFFKNWHKRQKSAFGRLFWRIHFICVFVLRATQHGFAHHGNGTRLLGFCMRFARDCIGLVRTTAQRGCKGRIGHHDTDIKESCTCAQLFFIEPKNEQS